MFIGGELFVVNEGNFDVEINAIEERAGDFGAVVFDLTWATAALANGISEKPARTGIEDSNEKKTGLELQGSGRAGNGHLAIFERLTQHFESGTPIFREFIEKEDAIVSERDFARAWVGSATEEPDIRDGVMRSAEGTMGHETFAGIKKPGDGMYAGCFDRFLLADIRHDGRHSFGEHRFPDVQVVSCARNGPSKRFLIDS